MKHMKLLGLTLMAAVALTAFVGAGTASAASTELFSGTTTLSAGTTITVSMEPGTSQTWSTTDESSIVNTCKSNAVDWKTAQTTVLNGPITGAIEEVTFSECNSTIHTGGTLPTGSLSITDIGDVNKDGVGDGTLTGAGTKFTTTLGVSCNYGTGASTHLGTVTGSTTGNATIDINPVINEQEPKSFLCPDTTKMVAKYVVTTPTKLNVQT